MNHYASITKYRNLFYCFVVQENADGNNRILNEEGDGFKTRKEAENYAADFIAAIPA
jgi:hypothetical protein